MTEPDWDDERLDAAFHARFDRPAPTDLAKEVHVRIAGTAPARFGGLRVARAWTYAAAAVVVVLVAGTALVGLGGLGRTGGSPLPSDASSAGTGPTTTPTEQALPGLVFDGALPIITVPDAIAVRDSGVDDRELAVAGWFRSGPAISCPFTPTVNPLQLVCPDELTWLMRDFGNGTVSQPFDPPAGPGFNPDLDGVDTAWEPSSGSAIDVAFVGHFDDRRASLCPPDEIAACRDRFVVDAVARVHGAEVATSALHEAEGAVSTDADIRAIIATEAPDSPILSMTVVDTDGLARLEPSLAPMVQGMVDHPRLWIVRVLESQRLSTYIVIDGSDAIYEMNPDNEAILVGGEPPTPEASASPSAWPPTGSRVVTLTSEVGAGKPPVEVAVVDQSSRLTSVSEKGDVDPATFSFDGRFGAYAESGHPGRVHLTWVGGICDSRITVTVAPDLGSVSFDMGPQPDCDTIGIGRQLVLDFSGLLDVPSIELVDATGGGAAPTVFCGPLAPDRCATRTAEVIAASPEKRVVRIEFLDECGTYGVTFDDGTSLGADVDCVASPEPTPIVDCGPLGPDTCQQRAEEIVAEAAPRAVVSITFEGDGCGSYRVTFSDGTETSVSRYCLTSPQPS